MESCYQETYTFSEVFKDYDEWKAFTDDLGITTENVDDAYNEMIYEEFYFKYFNVGINSYIVQNFKRSLASILRNHYNKYKQIYDKINSTYSLTLDDLRDAGSIISNSASNGSKTVSNTLEHSPIGFIVNQNVNFNDIPKLNAYLKAVDNFRDLYLEEFADLLKDKGLFWNITLPKVYMNYE